MLIDIHSESKDDLDIIWFTLSNSIFIQKLRTWSMYSDVESCTGRFPSQKQYVSGSISSEIQSGKM